MALHDYPPHNQTSPHHHDEHAFYNHEESATDLECPRCGKHCIIHTGDQTYACLNCGFRRDLSESSPTGLNLLFAIFLLMLLMSLVVI